MPEANSNHLAEIIARVAEGHDAALAEFYDCTCTMVFGLVRRILNNFALAEEVTLDIYLQVWRQAKKYDAKRAAPRTWLLMIARSRAIDSLRASRPGIMTRTFDCDLLIDKLPSVEETLCVESLQVMVRSSLDSLTANQREAIEMAFFTTV